MAAIPWGFANGLATNYLVWELFHDIVIFMAIWIILALVFGAIWGVLFVKLRLRMPSHSFLVRALLFSFGVWLILTVSPGWYFRGVPFVIPHFLYGESNLANLVGLLSWGGLFQYFFKRWSPAPSHTPQTEPTYEVKQRSPLKGAARGLLWVIDIATILVLFSFGLWNLTIQLLVLTVVVLLFTGEKKKDELR